MFRFSKNTGEGPEMYSENERIEIMVGGITNELLKNI